MPFHGILFDRPDNHCQVEEREPSFFADLNLDQILDAMVAGRDEYRLKPFFYTPLRDVDAVLYRHEVLRDLEEQPLLESVGAFAQAMIAMREHLARAEKLHYTYQKERWFLDAVAIYCDAVRSLADQLTRLDVKSRGFLAFRDYLTSYLDSDAFESLVAETQAVMDALASVKYSLHIRGNRVTVGKYGGEPDYSADVEKTFAKFKQGAVTDYRVRFLTGLEMNHVEARILNLVARLYPDVFQALDQYHTHHRTYLDQTISALDREIQFYLAYLEFIRPRSRPSQERLHPLDHRPARQRLAQRDTPTRALARYLRPHPSRHRQRDPPPRMDPGQGPVIKQAFRHFQYPTVPLRGERRLHEHDAAPRPCADVGAQPAHRGGVLMAAKLAYRWHLRRVLATRGIFSTAALRPLLATRGIHLSSSQVYRLVAETPERLSLRVLVALLDILDCQMPDLIEPVAAPATATRTPTAAAQGGGVGAFRPRPARVVPSERP